jgi:hypothetical protein
MALQRKNPNQVSGTSPTVVLSLRPRGLRPPSAAAYLGCTPFAIEEAWRNGTLKFRVIGGTRVSTTEQLDEWFDTFPEQSGKMAGRGRFLEVA